MARYRTATKYRVFDHHTGVEAGLTDGIVSVEGGDSYYRYERLGEGE